MTTRPWRNVWITGASSGLGRETAILLAQSGCRVYVTARRADELEMLATDHANIIALPGDVTNRSAMMDVVKTIVARDGYLDLAILNAAGYQPGPTSQITANDVDQLIAINLTGVVNSLLPCLESMGHQARGQIALIGSIAGYMGLPNAGFYGATKAALISYAESLRAELQDSGIKIQLVSPGFIKTPMTDQNEFPMPFIMPVEKAARRLISGLKGNHFEILFPRRFCYLLKIMQLLPYPLYFRLAKKLSRT